MPMLKPQKILYTTQPQASALPKKAISVAEDGQVLNPDLIATRSAIFSSEVQAIRLKFLADYPGQEAYELLSDEMAEQEDNDDRECFQFCLMQDLRLAWTAAKAVFGDAATAADAWKIHEATEEQLQAYSRSN